MKNLEGFGVQEMNIEEVREIEGGGPIGDFVHWLVNRDWSCDSGCQDRPNSPGDPTSWMKY
ncbi:hypothetical protein [Tenacibaculum dicentrarchi]|uniref:hypothetical protein n=1 Tax=Tenacibaculum dicentrarchi TaxID=669041 RepID=UPI000C7B6EBC